MKGINHSTPSPLKEQTVQTSNSLKRKRTEHDNPQKRVKRNDKMDIETEFGSNQILTTWQEVQASIPNDEIGSLEKASHQFFEIKENIHSQVLIKRIELKNLNFLLKIVHPCPLSEEVLAVELDIFDKIKTTCEEIMGSNRSKKQRTLAEKIIKRIEIDEEPTLIYNYGVLMSEKTSLRIEEINNQKSHDKNLIIKNNNEIISLLEEEIERFSFVRIACSSIEICDIYNFLNLGLGKCHKSLGLAYLKAGEEENKEEFGKLALQEFKLAIYFFNQCKNYDKKFPQTGTESLRQEVSEHLRICQLQIETIQKELVPVKKNCH